jgi:predicted phage terminase large subunit-like protein
MALRQIPADHRMKAKTLEQLGNSSAVVYAELPPPQPGPQEMFLESDVDIVFYGGAAGGGKSAALLLDFARSSLTDNPLYGGVIFRRTSPMIRNEGGLWDESAKFYPPVGATAKETRLEWSFPSGATVRFAHLQHEKNIHDWQGSQLSRVGFDELCHFSESQFFYLLSRARSTIGIKPLIRATMNPDADSWVASFIDWWIGDDGIVRDDRSGVVRWFIRHNGKVHWSDAPETLSEMSGGSTPKSFTFIKAKLSDNPILTEGDPDYLSNLQSLHPVDRARLLDGNWRTRMEAGSVFQRNWFEIVEPEYLQQITQARGADWEEFRFWDFAATELDIKGPDPCATAGVKIRRVGDTFYIMDDTEVFESPGQANATVYNTATQDGQWCKVRWETEPGSSGIRDGYTLINMLRGFDARGMDPVTNKVMRAKPLATAAFNGKVKLVRGDWNAGFLNAAVSFPGTKKGKDSIDAASGAFAALSGSNVAYRETKIKWGH